MIQPLSPFRRIHYVQGQILTADDLTAEQEYHRGKQRLQNQLLFGMGIATGLACRWSRRKGLLVEPGVAIDCRGHEIVVPKRQQMHVPAREGRFHLALAATERGVVATPSPESEGLVHTMIEEGFELLLLDAPPCERHAGRPDGRWDCCGGDHPVPLARLRWKKERLRVKLSGAVAKGRSR